MEIDANSDVGYIRRKSARQVTRIWPEFDKIEILWILANVDQIMHQISKNVWFSDIIEFVAVQSCANRVDFENGCKTNSSIWLQTSASIEPRASPPKLLKNKC